MHNKCKKDSRVVKWKDIIWIPSNLGQRMIFKMLWANFRNHIYATLVYLIFNSIYQLDKYADGYLAALIF